MSYASMPAIGLAGGLVFLVVLNERILDVNVQLHVHGCEHIQEFGSFLVSSMNIIHPIRHAAVDTSKLVLLILSFK